MHLEQCLSLAKTATTSKTLPTVIEGALNSRNVFVYGELVQLCQEILKKEGTPDGGSIKLHYQTLELFAYGSWSDYQKNKAKYIPLSDKMQRNLRLITIQKLCMDNTKLSYKEIADSCGLGNLSGNELVEQVEALVLAAIQS